MDVSHLLDAPPSVTVPALEERPVPPEAVDEPDAAVADPAPILVTFEALYRREYEPMLRVAFLLVGSDGVAEEVVQDAFVRVHGRFDRLTNPGGYLRSCVVNGCRDRLRRRARLAERLPRLVSDAEAPAGGLDRADLYHSLLRLPLRQRAAVVLRFYGGWPDDEIAEAIGVRHGTVKSLVHRGLAALRKELDP